MAELADRQIELNGYVFGYRTKVLVNSIEFGGAEPRTNDAQRPRNDGTRFGREWRAGRTITFELTALGPDETILDEVSRFASVWDGLDVRTSPGDVSVLRWNYAGRVRRAYGRPRRLETDNQYYRSGKVTITATFDTEGPYYYDDQPAETAVTIAPASTGGFTFPMTFPARTAGMGERRTGLVIPGDSPAPLVLTVRGPIENPTVEVPGYWRFQLLDTLTHDQTIIIDTRPWALTVRKGATNAAGRIAVGSPRLPSMWLPPGSHDVILRGSDPSASASLNVTAWPAYASY